MDEFKPRLKNKKDYIREYGLIRDPIISLAKKPKFYLHFIDLNFKYNKKIHDAIKFSIKRL